MTDQAFMAGLQRHLWRSELQYRMEKAPHGSNVDWLIPHCDNVRSIAEFLRELGFRIKETIDETDAEGTRFCWVITTSGLIVYANTAHSRGLVAMSPEEQQHRESKAAGKV